MVFLKPLDDLKYEDIERLKSNKTCESDILDYKEQLLRDDEFLKHVSAFANTQGGYLIFGVKETGKGGYPKEISGIEGDIVNKERMEQIILSNIQPRLNVKIEEIGHQDQSKVFVVIRIPNSHLKPHMRRQGDKFYKRFNFEALAMTEMEVSDAYKRRFTGYQEVESYLSQLLEIKVSESLEILGRIIVIPTMLKRIINTSDIKEFEWMKQLSFKPKGLYLPSSTLTPSSNGVKSQYQDRELEIHRNGCIDYKEYFGAIHEEEKLFLHNIFCIKLMHTLQFASTLYQNYNYFGDVKIICNLHGVESSLLVYDKMRRGPFRLGACCRSAKINISREFPINMVESKYEFITSGIMDEIFNNYEMWKCPYFDDVGNFKEDSTNY